MNLRDVLDRDRKGLLSGCLLICDEVHNIGSDANVRELRGQLGRFPWRLGLSATPEREYDDHGSKFIIDELGKVIFEFGLEKAIQKGILCEFDYEPLEYELTDGEVQALQQAHKRYHARVANGEPVSKEELYMELARIRKASVGKLPVLRDYLAANPGVLKRCLVFVEDTAYGNHVQEILRPHILDYHTFYEDDQKEELVRFARGELECLLTCRRISEGIDVRSVSNIILMSADRAKLQTIQRMGRCLRTDPSNPGKRSRVIDFVRHSDLVAAAGPLGERADAERFKWLSELAKTRKEA
jgi:superfamily II DNA or RNA helicase